MTLGQAYEYVKGKWREAFYLCVQCPHSYFPNALVEAIRCEHYLDPEECAYKQYVRELKKELDISVSDFEETKHGEER